MEGCVASCIDFIFTSDENILAINSEFLKHNYFTDVITFDYSEGRTIIGEIYVSAETVGRNASSFGVGRESEFRRVMVHGILHLCGYSDGVDTDRTVMKGREDYYLKLFSDEFQI
jgi:probable rRNA maturation factor